MKKKDNTRVRELCKSFLVAKFFLNLTVKTDLNRFINHSKDRLKLQRIIKIEFRVKIICLVLTGSVRIYYRFEISTKL